MYWSLEVARKELKQRQQNTELRRKVDEFLGNCPIPNNSSQGFLFRHIASARLEDCQFEERCGKVNLKSIFFTYPKDIFVSNNPSKTRLIRLFIFDGYGKRGGPRLQRIDLLKDRNMDRINGVPLSLIKTKWGEPLVQFHQRTRKVVGLRGETIDASDWLKSIGQAKEYYRHLLAACLIRGILFESFESPGFPNLEAFKETVVFPAWKWVQTEFNCLPLIVKHPDTDSAEEEKRILNWYPQAVLEAIPK